jgi:VanZ family protein
MISFLRKSPLVIAWAIAALVLLGLVVWASRQVNDPLSVYIRTDKMQHIIAFGVLGFLAALMRSAGWRIRALAATLTLAIVVEWIQIPIHDRTASLSDLLASIVGVFAGFGFCVAGGTALALVRGQISSRERTPASRET